MRNLLITFGILIACAAASLQSLPSLAAETYQIYAKKVRKVDILRFREGDTVVYHRADGSVQTFILGKFLGEGENGRVFVLEGSADSEVIKFSKNNYSLNQEARSLEKLHRQKIPHAQIRRYEPDFYLIKDMNHGKTLQELNEGISTLPHGERIEILKNLNSALEHFDKALQKGPAGFDDIHAANVLFDGKTLHVIDVGEYHGNPAVTASEFRSDIQDLSNIGPSLGLLKEDPVWLERFYDLRNASGRSFLSSDEPEAVAIRNAFRLGRRVPPIIQEQVISAAVRESSSPLFRERLQPLLNSILSRGEIEGPSVHAMMNLLLEHAQTPSELVELANTYSKTLSHKTPPTITFFRRFANSASWDDVLHVFDRIPSEFKPILVGSVIDAAKRSSTALGKAPDSQHVIEQMKAVAAKASPSASASCIVPMLISHLISW